MQTRWHASPNFAPAGMGPCARRRCTVWCSAVPFVQRRPRSATVGAASGLLRPRQLLSGGGAPMQRGSERARCKEHPPRNSRRCFRTGLAQFCLELHPARRDHHEPPQHAGLGSANAARRLDAAFAAARRGANASGAALPALPRVHAQGAAALCTRGMRRARCRRCPRAPKWPGLCALLWADCSAASPARQQSRAEQGCARGAIRVHP